MRFNTLSDGAIISELCCRIKETRMQLGLSQIELAERARVGTATIKRAELGESVTLSTLIGILRGLGRLHQLESILSDSHMRTFNAQFTAAPPARIRIRKKQRSQSPAADTTEAVAERPASATINEWYTSSEVRSMVWSDLATESESK
ncbi:MULTISPECIES: helix-turn-helix domain-containing protein [Pantoea]|jgi:transcriptional regulator with XRE-family HTH domain|uniref:Helix-turn-helix transcriptional regulator n=1 Tax=Pantoea brenneri TaxID=472694 RepID=A0A7Y6NEV4_9GAMM|nr:MULTISPECIES: helix-turn-helix transcriptional regulator [Pantoea]MBZ6397967.1 helix-turn-helix transcriptional regulator [Pantoea sp.]MDH1085677.1 helix-turn-helix transcriptional regulator [Pantoea brenneri]MDU7866664.1 helix-turn-helix transcriptional regulator [Pantoea sp.]NUY42044.1 helix-turn-helix transcriptional regulator [Pantoea brenneri]NUY49669.1 helix-turn-helix transcriptional regulator [Pantoea brenneri]